MSFIKTIFTHKIAVLKILVITFIFIYIFVNQIIKHTHQYIKDNWNYYQTKPYFAPLAGFFQKDSNESIGKVGVKSVLQLIWTYIKMFFQLLIKPFQYIIDIVYKIIDAIRYILDKFREQLAVIRKMLLSILEKAMDRLQEMGSSLISLFLRLRELMKRSFATYQTMLYTVQTTGLTMKSMMDGPVGDMASLASTLGIIMTTILLGGFAPLMFPSLFYCLLFCFHPETQIKLRNYQTMSIQKIAVGTHLVRGYVTGKLVFYQPTPQPLYQYCDDLVTGSHYLLDKNWYPVQDHKVVEKTNITSPLLYCLATSNHRIITPSGLYLDYDETSDLDKLYQMKINLLKRLNRHVGERSTPGDREINYSRDHLYQEGFLAEDTPLASISESDLPYQCRKTRNTIIGIGQWEATSDIRWYRHHLSNIRVTGSLIISEENQWIPVYQSRQFTEITSPLYEEVEPYVTNWVSKEGSLYLDGFIARDLLETHDNDYHEQCTKISIS